MKYDKQVFRSLAMVTQLGLSVMTPIFLCLIIGYLIDSRFHAKTMLLFLVLGVLAGARSGYVMAKAIVAAGEKDDRQKRAEGRGGLPDAEENEDHGEES